MECVKPITVIKDGVSIRLPCNRCIACRLNYANYWSTRIVCESHFWKYSSFVTLTYNDDNLIIGEKGFATLSKEHCQNFFKELRGKGVKVRYFLGGEYGDIHNTHRPHYHICMFSDNEAITDNTFLQGIWRKGFLSVGSLTRDSANYVAKYCVKKLGGKEAYRYEQMGIIPEFALMSRRPGIGLQYIEKFKETVKRNGFVVVNGKKQPIPRYFGTRIFTEEEKNQRFIDNQVRQFDKLYKVIKDKNAKDIYQADDFIILQSNPQREKNIKARMDLKRRKL